MDSVFDTKQIYHKYIAYYACSDISYVQLTFLIPLKSMANNAKNVQFFIKYYKALYWETSQYSMVFSYFFGEEQKQKHKNTHTQTKEKPSEKQETFRGCFISNTEKLQNTHISALLCINDPADIIIAQLRL